MAQLVAHLVRDQEVAGSSPVIQTKQAWRPLSPTCFLNLTGELSEWLKEPASKTGVRVTVPGVRIPHSPQSRMASQRSCGAFLLKGASRASSCKTLSAKKHQRAVGPGCHSMLCKGPSGEELGNAQGLRPEHNPHPAGGYIPNNQQVAISRPTLAREGNFR